MMELYGSPPRGKGDHFWMLMGKHADSQVFHCLWCKILCSMKVHVSFKQRAGFDGATKTVMKDTTRWFDGTVWRSTRDQGYPPCPGPVAPRSEQCGNTSCHNAAQLIGTCGQCRTEELELAKGQAVRWDICAHCGEPATCVGTYEDPKNLGMACDDCCGHGNESGECTPISTLADVLRNLESDLVEAEEEHYQMTLKLQRALQFSGWWKGLASRQYLELYYRNTLVEELRSIIASTNATSRAIDAKAEAARHEAEHATSRELEECIALLEKAGDWSAAQLLIERQKR